MQIFTSKLKDRNRSRETKIRTKRHKRETEREKKGRDGEK